MAIAINDAYVTNAGANSSSALGAATVKADTLIVVAHKAAKTANADSVPKLSKLLANFISHPNIFI